MNGHDFIIEVKKQIQAINYMGECCSNYGTTYSDYDRCEKKMLDFMKRNHINFCLCLDAMDFNHMWGSTDDAVNDMIELFEVGDYDECLMVLTKNNTMWKHRVKLEKLNITIY